MTAVGSHPGVGVPHGYLFAGRGGRRRHGAGGVRGGSADDEPGVGVVVHKLLMGGTELVDEVVHHH